MKNVKIKIITLLFVILAANVYSQDKYSLLFAIGYKSSYSTCTVFNVGYNLNDKIKIELGPSLSFTYGGQGISSGLKWLFFRKGFFSTSLNADYRFLLPAKVSIGYDDDTKVVGFKNPATNHCFVGTSLNFTLNEKKVEGRNMALSLNFCYGLPFEKYKTSYRYGVYSSDVEREINNQMAGGFGFSISVTENFH